MEYRYEDWTNEAHFIRFKNDLSLAMWCGYGHNDHHHIHCKVNGVNTLILPENITLLIYCWRLSLLVFYWIPLFQQICHRIQLFWWFAEFNCSKVFLIQPFWCFTEFNPYNVLLNSTLLMFCWIHHLGFLKNLDVQMFWWIQPLWCFAEFHPSAEGPF